MKKLIVIITVLLSLMVFLATPVYAIGEIVGPDVIYKDSNEIITINDITSLYSSSGAAIYASSDKFTGKGHLIGNHEITLTATDGLVEKTKEIVVSVNSNKIPNVEESTENIFKLVGASSTGYTFVVLQDKTITLEIIRDTLISLGLLTVVEPSSKNIILDTYTENKTTPGTYSLNFRILDSTGAIKTFNNSVKVLMISEDWEPLDPSEQPGIINVDWGFVGTIIGSLFSMAVLVVLVVVGINVYKKFNRKVKKGD